MQEKEFDHLMDGKSAKFAEMFMKSDNDTDGLAGLLAKAQQKNAPLQVIEEAREEISKREVDIPSKLRGEIDTFINKNRSAGKSERQLRRMVQKKFHISVV